MKVKIIPSDGIVTVDGLTIGGIDLGWIPSNVHAVTWDGNSGEAEIMDDSGQIVSNIKLNSFSEYSPVLGLFNSAKDVLYPPEVLPTIQNRRLAVWEKIKAHRTFVEGDGVYVQGHWYHTDADSRIKFMRLDRKADIALAAGGQASTLLQVVGNNIYWKTLPNVMVGVTCSIAQGVVQATEILDATGYARAEVLRNQVMASNSPESINIMSGWPVTYSTRNVEV